MNARTLVMLAAGGSAALLIGAVGSEFLAGLTPCKLCHWQRWPHDAAVLIGIVFLAGVRWRGLPLLGALAALTTAGIGVYHTGVEQKWWQGPTGCTGFDITGMTPGQLMEAITAAPLIRCDEIQWMFLGMSMASWNALFSLVLAALWIAAWRRASA